MSPGWQAFVVLVVMGVVAAGGIELVRRGERRTEEQLRAGVQAVMDRYASRRSPDSASAAVESRDHVSGGPTLVGGDSADTPPPTPQSLVGAPVPRPAARTRLHIGGRRG